MKPPARVLLVEDEDIVAMLTESMLTDLGYELHASAATLASGVKVAEAGNFDVAVLDVNLRGLKSYPIADILMTRKIPFVFVSGYSAQGMPHPYSSAFALQKPFSVDALKQILLRVLPGHAE